MKHKITDIVIVGFTMIISVLFCNADKHIHQACQPKLMCAGMKYINLNVSRLNV